MNVSEIPVSSIKPYSNNPRDNTEAVEKVMESIREFGFQQPIVVDSDMVIIVGHTRYEAAKQLGMETVPTVIAKELSPEKVKAYRLADNKVAEFSYWDWDKLAEEFKELQMSDIDFGKLGFDYDFGFVGDAESDDDVTDEGDHASADFGNVGDGVNSNAAGNGNTGEFSRIDENIKTQHQCPMCGYEW